MLSRTTRITLPLLVLLAAAGCRADLGDNQNEDGLEGVELIGEEEQTNSTGTFPLEADDAVDPQGGEARESGTATLTPGDTTGMAADTLP